MQKQDNFVRLSGKVVNRYDKGNVTMITLLIAETVRQETKFNYPKIYFFHEDNTGVENYLVNDQVSVICHVATPRKRRNSNGQEYISQALVGDVIEPRKRMSELLGISDLANGPYEPSMNHMSVTGQISAIRKTGDRSAQIIVDTENDGHMNFASINMATPNIFNMKIGDRVTVVGKVVTGRYEPRTPEEKPVYYQHLVGLSVKLADKNVPAKSVVKPETAEPGAAVEA